MITGLDSALFSLGRLPAQLQQALTLETEKAAQEALKTAQALAPVKTGALRSSLHVLSLPQGAELLASRPYAIYLEYGTRRMSARPFLLPALRASHYSARMRRAMQEAIL